MFFTQEGADAEKKKSLLSGKKAAPKANNKNEMGMINARLEPALKSLISGKDSDTGEKLTASDKKMYLQDVMKAVRTGLVKKSNARVKAALSGGK